MPIRPITLATAVGLEVSRTIGVQIKMSKVYFSRKKELTHEKVQGEPTKYSWNIESGKFLYNSDNLKKIRREEKFR